MFTKNRFSFITRFVLALLLITGILGVNPVISVHAATIIVTNTNDSGAGSLRQAIADAASGDTVTFDPLLVSYSIINLFSSLVIDKDLIIDASGLTNPLFVDFRNSGNLQVLNSTVTISNLIIGRGYSEENGGAIWSNGNLTIKNTTIMDSYAVGNGGAIYSSGLLSIQKSALYKNEANDSGGAIYIENNGVASSIANTTISKNISRQYGGGLFAIGSPIITIVNSTIAQNNASLAGSQIVTRGLSELILNNSVVACWWWVNDSCTDFNVSPVLTNSIADYLTHLSLE